MASQLEDLLLRELDRAGISPSWHTADVKALPIQQLHKFNLESLGEIFDFLIFWRSSGR